jgi:hypothetical protein
MKRHQTEGGQVIEIGTFISLGLRVKILACVLNVYKIELLIIIYHKA